MVDRCHSKPFIVFSEYGRNYLRMGLNIMRNLGCLLITFLLLFTLSITSVFAGHPKPTKEQCNTRGLQLIYYPDQPLVGQDSEDFHHVRWSCGEAKSSCEKGGPEDADLVCEGRVPDIKHDLKPEDATSCSVFLSGEETQKVTGESVYVGACGTVSMRLVPGENCASRTPPLCPRGYVACHAGPVGESLPPYYTFYCAQVSDSANTNSQSFVFDNQKSGVLIKILGSISSLIILIGIAIFYRGRSNRKKIISL